MKRIILFYLMLLLLSVAAQAQTSYPRHELSVSYGFASLHSFSHPGDFSGGSAAGPQTTYGTANESYSDAINVSYLYHLSQSFAIGLAYTHSSMDADIVTGSSEAQGVYSNTCHTVMLTGKYSWLRISKFSFYSRLAVGLTLQKGELESNDPYVGSAFANADLDAKKLAWQAMPLGVEWNLIPHLAIYAEGGAGVSGCALAGLKVFF